jgi:hypothetical protein
VRGPYLQRAESLDGAPNPHSRQVLADVPVEERCTCEHVPIVNIPGVKFMKTVKKREPGEKVAADASAPVREGL